ncbi:MAG: alpha/beta fold hydrolase [Burkholderiales bacterium]|nr:alpha/beta fold hydrolase [Burkholderiales bacterium]
MKRVAFWVLKRGLLLIAVFIAGGLALRAWNSLGGPQLEPWHTYVPEELSEAELDRSTWADYIEAENRLYELMKQAVTRRLKPEDRVPHNRYYEGSAVYPAHFAQDWNRSFVLEPKGEPAGVVLLLHGLTDSPYTVRHLAAHYRDRGYVALAMRLPAHGTVPAALTRVQWEDGLAATRMAVREARRRVGAPKPFHMVGYSTGGALTLKYTLDALKDERLARPDRIVLLSPMIGVSAFARFAGFAGWPAVLPAFAKTAWLDLLPEYNPFKYNSFPVNAAVQSHRLSTTLQAELAQASRENRLSKLPPILTFQSAVDDTVSVAAVISALYGMVPANGSELVLFDLNRSVDFGLLVKPGITDPLVRLLPPAPRRYGISVVTNADANTDAVIERRMAAGTAEETRRPLPLAFPREVYSLSHIAVPFPTTDALYGLQPDLAENYGIRLGVRGLRGERGVLVVDAASLLRLGCNPFYPYLIERIAAAIDGR